jgi:hypothetical protein
MKKILVLSLFLPIAAAVYAQDLGGSGLQFSGVLSMNFIDDFYSSTASTDTLNGLSYLQLNPSLKEGPFGFDSELSFGPGGSWAFKYGYGYADLWNGRFHVAIGKFVDPDTFALTSFYAGGPDGPGSYGNASVVNAQGGTGYGINGIELKVSPQKNLVFGLGVPYQSQADTVDTSLKRIFGAVSYTAENLVQLVIGYTQGHTGVADLASPINNLNQNKAYLIANVLVSDTLVLGGRYELDHDVSSWTVISNNAYLTAGAKLQDFSIGGDVGLYLPRGASAGFEVLGSTTYTLKSIFTSVDLQPYLAVSYVSSTYQESTFNAVTINPQLRLLLGKSQHEIAVGYTVTIDTAHPLQPPVDQMNILMQVYF